MTSLKNLKNIKGKRVIVRTDFNVPLKGKRVVDITRISVALPTIMFLRKAGARVVLISHIGRDPKESLKPVYNILKKSFPITFIPNVVGDDVFKFISEMKNGDVVLLENLRSNPGEKSGDVDFAKSLANLGDIYVNEAFPVSHREDASIVGIPKILPSYAGFQLEREVKELSKVLNPKHPFLFILGGSKAETKIPLLKRYLKEADNVFVGGVLANNFFKANGCEVGKSVVDKDVPPLSSLIKNKKLIMPLTVVLGRGKKKDFLLSDVTVEDSILDVGEESIKALAPIIAKAKLILWNGPMGWYEGGYTKATELLLSMLAKSKAETIIGGGDTSVLVEKKKLADKFTFVSTGGGATLEFLAKGTLPGIKALK